MTEDGDGNRLSFDRGVQVENATRLVIVVYARKYAALGATYFEGGDATWHDTLRMAH